MSLKDFIYENGLSIKRLARVIDIPYHRVYNIYLQKMTPSLVDCLKIIYATKSKVKIDYLLSEKDRINFDEFVKEFKELDMKNLKRYKSDRQ
jgi:hypothetical protein